MPSPLELIRDALRVSKRDVGPLSDAYGAGYRNLVHRTVGDIDNPGLRHRVNANVGAHADLSGGRQAEDIRQFMVNAGLPNPDTMQLLMRSRRPIFMTDAEVNDPMLMSNALHDRQLAKEVNWAQFRYPEHMVDLPVAGYDDPQLPLFRVLNRRAAERALQRKGYDVVVYPNEIEGGVNAYDPYFVDDAVMSSPRKREELARSILENNPVPSLDSFIIEKLNPSVTTVDYSNYRDPFGDLLRRGDYTTEGYCDGGLVALSHGKS